jgi:tetratricopeptide (TPR) repeat protein
MKYDRFDIVNAVSVAALLLAAGFYAVRGDAAPSRAAVTRAAASSAPAICAELARARATFEAGKSAKAVERLKAFTAANPDVAEGHLLLAKAFAAQQQYPSSIREYRQALVLDPEYADKASEKFIGKGIKSVLQHGWAPCEISLAPTQDDPARKAVLEDAQYIYRMLAGGCE